MGNNYYYLLLFFLQYRGLAQIFKKIIHFGTYNYFTITYPFFWHHRKKKKRHYENRIFFLNNLNIRSVFKKRKIHELRRILNLKKKREIELFCVGMYRSKYKKIFKIFYNFAGKFFEN